MARNLQSYLENELLGNHALTIKEYFSDFSLTWRSKKIAAWITLASVVVSVVITYIAMELVGKAYTTSSFFIPALIPLFIAPVCALVVLENSERMLKYKDELRLEKERMLEQQKELFAVVGHELRTPVAAISMVGRDADIDAVSAREEIVEISENLLAVLEDLRVVVAPERALEKKIKSDVILSE